MSIRPLENNLLLGFLLRLSVNYNEILLLFKFFTFSIVSLFLKHYVSRDGMVHR
jgi:hypothetical protein